MLKLMTRLLVISCVMLFLSCKTYTIEGVSKKETNQTIFENPYFSNPEIDYVYKAHIEVYGNDLSGIFVVKMINDSVHRIVITTDFGNKILDVELSEDSFKVNYILENLNKKIIINTLKKDFRLLVQRKHLIHEVVENDTHIIYISEDQKRRNYFYENKRSGTFEKLQNASKSKEKVAFSFISKNTTFAESILIQHYNIKLKIELNQITN